MYNIQAILNLIKSIRESFIGAKELYLNGGCYRFAEILKAAYPEGIIVRRLNHALFEYRGYLFDITGVVAELDNLSNDELKQIDYSDYNSFENNQVPIAYNDNTAELIFNDANNEIKYIASLLNSEFQMMRFKMLGCTNDRLFNCLYLFLNAYRLKILDNPLFKYRTVCSVINLQTNNELIKQYTILTVHQLKIDINFIYGESKIAVDIFKKEEDNGSV
jgi:hypothetical protein